MPISIGDCVTHKSNPDFKMNISDIQTKDINSVFGKVGEKYTGKVKCVWIDKEGHKQEEIFNISELLACKED